MKTNEMRKVILEKVTVNICVGNDRLTMVKAQKLLEKLTERKPVVTSAKKRLADWQIRPGLNIGYKVTLRGDSALKFLLWVLKSKGDSIKKKSIDSYGNFSIGVSEYLDLPSMKYDPDIGILGFEAMATFIRKGTRISRRRLRSSKIPHRHRVTQEEVVTFLKEQEIKVV